MSPPGAAASKAAAGDPKKAQKELLPFVGLRSAFLLARERLLSRDYVLRRARVHAGAGASAGPAKVLVGRERYEVALLSAGGGFVAGGKHREVFRVLGLLARAACGMEIGFVAFVEVFVGVVGVGDCPPAGVPQQQVSLIIDGVNELCWTRFSRKVVREWDAVKETGAAGAEVKEEDQIASEGDGLGTGDAVPGFEGKSVASRDSEIPSEGAATRSTPRRARLRRAGGRSESEGTVSDRIARGEEAKKVVEEFEASHGMATRGRTRRIASSANETDEAGAEQEAEKEGNEVVENGEETEEVAGNAEEAKEAMGIAEEPEGAVVAGKEAEGAVVTGKEAEGAVRIGEEAEGVVRTGESVLEAALTGEEAERATPMEVDAEGSHEGEKVDDELTLLPGSRMLCPVAACRKDRSRRCMRRHMQDMHDGMLDKMAESVRNTLLKMEKYRSNRRRRTAAMAAATAVADDNDNDDDDCVEIATDDEANAPATPQSSLSSPPKSAADRAATEAAERAARLDLDARKVSSALTAATKDTALSGHVFALRLQRLMEKLAMTRAVAATAQADALARARTARRASLRGRLSIAKKTRRSSKIGTPTQTASRTGSEDGAGKERRKLAVGGGLNLPRVRARAVRGRRRTRAPRGKLAGKRRRGSDDESGRAGGGSINEYSSNSDSSSGSGEEGGNNNGSARKRRR